MHNLFKLRHSPSSGWQWPDHLRVRWRGEGCVQFQSGLSSSLSSWSPDGRSGDHKERTHASLASCFGWAWWLVQSIAWQCPCWCSCSHESGPRQTEVKWLHSAVHVAIASCLAACNFFFTSFENVSDFEFFSGKANASPIHLSPNSHFFFLPPSRVWAMVLTRTSYCVGGWFTTA